MTPERASIWVARWVRLYTLGLAPAVAERRREEIGADMGDHIAHERSVGEGDSRIATAVVSRMARGMTADVTWRWRAQPTKGDFMKPLIALLVVGLAVAAVAFVADSPLLLLASVAVIGSVILGVFILGVRAAQEGDFVVPYVVILGAALAIAALAVTAIVAGAWDDAPGLVLLGIVLIVTDIVGVFTLGLRSAQRSN
jgi:hypothetical protein